MEITEDEIPFDIPESWCWCRLGEIATVIRGLTFSQSFKTQHENTSLVLRGGNIDSKTEEIVYTDNIFVDSTIIKEHQYINKGDVLIVASSGTKSSVGKSTLILDDLENVSFGGFMMVVRPSDYILPLYLSIQIKLYRNKIISETVGYISNITNPILNNLYIPLPPLAEQKRIVAAIEKFMPLIEEYGKKETVLNDLNAQIGTVTKKAILQEAVQGKLVPQITAEGNAKDLLEQIKAQKATLIKEGKVKKEKDVTPIELDEKELPKGWTYIKLGEISSIITKQTGFDYSASIKPNLSEICLPNMIPMVQTKNFKGKSFELNTDYYISKDIAEKFPKILLDSKCMLLSIVGASIGNVGIYDNPTLAMIGGAICKVKLLDDRFYDYLFYFLQSKSGQDEIYKNFKSTAQGTITVQDVREITIPMPPLSEQKRIVAAIERLLSLCEQLGK